MYEKIKTVYVYRSMNISNSSDYPPLAYSNHRSFDCLFNSFLRLTQSKFQNCVRYWPFVRGSPTGDLWILLTKGQQHRKWFYFEASSRHQKHAEEVSLAVDKKLHRPTSVRCNYIPMQYLFISNLHTHKSLCVMIHLAVVKTIEGVITTSQRSATLIAEPQVPSVGGNTEPMQNYVIL